MDQDTGCSDVSMDPTNPDVLYAGMWQFRRKPYSFESGGPKSAFFKSNDGGKTFASSSEQILIEMTPQTWLTVDYGKPG